MLGRVDGYALWMLELEVGVLDLERVGEWGFESWITERGDALCQRRWILVIIHPIKPR